MQMKCPCRCVRNFVPAALVISTVVYLTLPAEAQFMNRDWPQQLHFSENATGGVFGFSRNNGPVCPVMTIQTLPGETPEAVAQKLAGAINAVQDTDATLGVVVVGLSPEKHLSMADGETLKMRTTLMVFTCGSETGLGIPRSPSSLTADWNSETNEIRIVWENRDEYDRLTPRLPFWGVGVISADATDHVIPTSILSDSTFRDYFEKFGHLLFRLIAKRDGIPSGAADLEIRPNSIAEIYRVPFSGGVAPNWESWCIKGDRSMQFYQGTRWQPTTTFDSRQVSTPEKAPYYQVIEAQGGVVDGGLYRKFLGLTPGKRYKLNMRLQPTREGTGGDPSLTVNALCAPSIAGSLTERQMTGQAALPAAPDGAHFKQHVPFQRNGSRKWLQLDKLEDVEPDAHAVTMPEGCDTLHVWLRLQSNGAHATVGMDWVELSKVD
jgi:hypothetical protein